MEGEETFDSSFLGYADEVVEERISDDEIILVKGTKNTSAVSVVYFYLFCIKYCKLIMEFLFSCFFTACLRHTFELY